MKNKKEARKDVEMAQAFLADMERIIRPGRKVANAFQGSVSLDLVIKTFARSRLSPAAILEKLRLIFQSDRAVQEVVVPYFSSFFELLSKDKLVIYKGVSFNPLVATFGENVNLLDFHSWMKSMESRAIVLDASWYAVVNMAKRSLVETFSPRAAEEAIKFLEREKDNYPEVTKAAGTRERYLRAMSVALFPPHQAPLVISAEEMWWQVPQKLDKLS